MLIIQTIATYTTNINLLLGKHLADCNLLGLKQSQSVINGIANIGNMKNTTM